MIPTSAAEIATITNGRVMAGNGEAVAVSVDIDSRRVDAGTCFVAIVGPRDDGHRYLQQAIASGAAVLLIQNAAVIEHLVGLSRTGVVLVPDTTAALQRLAAHIRERVDPTVVAITGSIGKTTTKALTYELIRHTRPTHATPGNFNNQWGLPLSLLGLQEQHVWMVAELGMSAAGEIAALTELARPRIGVITNVAPVHMQYFSDLAGVAAAKRELADGLPDSGTLVANADDPRTARMAADCSARLARVITFGRGPSAAVRASQVRATGTGWRLQLNLPGERTRALDLPLPGGHSLANFLAAAAAAVAIGVDAGEIVDRAPRLRLPTMRGQIHQTDAGVIVLDDSYNASPAAMISAIETLAQLPGDGRLILAAGDMLELGTWSEEAHREVGLLAAQVGYDLICTVGPLARDIAAGARAGGLDREQTRSFSSAQEAADALLAELRAGDRLLVKGSRAMGMEAITRHITHTRQDEGH